MRTALRANAVKAALSLLVALSALALGGCHSIYRTDSPSADDFAREKSFVFVRPKRFSVLGTRSLRDHCEIMYEEFSVNDAGQPVIKFGIRNKGGQHWWDRSSMRIVIAAKAVFYESPIVTEAVTSPPVYETNWQRIPITRGETSHYSFVCPKDAQGYQITLSDAF